MNNRLTTTLAALEAHLRPSGLHIPDGVGLSVLPVGLAPRDLVALAGGVCGSGKPLDEVLEGKCLALNVGELRALVAAGHGPSSTLHAEITWAHAENRINENALEELLAAINRGQRVSIDMLATAFGVERIYEVLLDARALDRLANAITERVRKDLDL